MTPDQQPATKPAPTQSLGATVEAISKRALDLYAAQEQRIQSRMPMSDADARRLLQRFHDGVRAEIQSLGFQPPKATNSINADSGALAEFFLKRGYLVAGGIRNINSANGVVPAFTVSIDKIGAPQNIRASEITLPAAMGGDSLSKIGALQAQISERVIVPDINYLHRTDDRRGTIASTMGYDVAGKPLIVLRPGEYQKSFRSPMTNEAGQSIKINELANAFFNKYLLDRVPNSATVKVDGQVGVATRAHAFEAFSDYIQIKDALSGKNAASGVSLVVSNVTSQNPNLALSLAIFRESYDEASRGSMNAFARLGGNPTIREISEFVRTDEGAARRLGEILVKHYEQTLGQLIRPKPIH